MHKISDLPIHEHRAAILKAIQENRVVIISGKTGCGKSTQVPKYILEHFPDANIAVCEPRRLAATSLAMRVSEQLEVRVGGKVGYQIGMESRWSQKTRVTFMTYGILIQQLLFNSNIEYTHIVLDEVHERSLEMDFTFIALKKILDSHKKMQTKVIIMSATINSLQFAKHFSTHSETLQFRKPIIKYKQAQKKVTRGGRRNQQSNKTSYINAEIVFQTENYQQAEAIDLPEKSLYKTVQYFADQIENNQFCPDYKTDEDVRINSDTYLLTMSIINQTLQKIEGDILVFVPGMFQIKTLKEMLMTHHKNPIPAQQIVQVHSAYSEELYQRLFKDQTKNKVIIATNIGQSSITLPFCKTVVDFCLTRKNINVRAKGYERFETRVASKANLLQRAGRVGRIADGIVYRLIRKDFYKEMDDFQLPQIKCVSLDMVILRAKQIDKTYNSNLFEDPYEVIFNAIDPPEYKQIHQAIQYLIEEQALVLKKQVRQTNDCMRFTGSDLAITKMGEFMVMMPCNIRISKMILFALEMGVGPTVIDIAAIQLTSKIFFLHQEKRRNIEEFMHSIIGYDRGNYNDFLMRQKMFSHWRTIFFEKFYTNNYKNKQILQNRAEGSLIEKALQHFSNVKISQEEYRFCDDRGVSPWVMRDILRISQNIRQRLKNAQMKVEQSRDDVPNQFIILCLCIAFQGTTCSVEWKNKGVYRGPPEENWVSLIQSQVTTEGNIQRYMDPLPFPQIVYEKGGFMKIITNCEGVSKFLLPRVYTKANLNNVSPLFRHLCQNSTKITYIYPESIVREQVRQVTILNDSINKFNVRPNHREEYMLVSDKILQSKGKYFMGPCALIQKKKLILIKIMTAKKVFFEPHPSYEFYSKVIINGEEMELPFFLDDQDINIILEFRKFSQQDKSKKIEQGKVISHIKRSKFQNLLLDMKLKPKIEEWNYVFNETVQMYKRTQQKPISIQNLKQLRKMNPGCSYFDRYRKWKIQQYQNLYKNFRALSIKTASIICAKCWPNELTMIQDLESFDVKKKVLKLNEYRGSWTSDKNDLLCSKRHKVGIILNEDEGKIVPQSVLMYAPFKKVSKFDGEQASINETIKSCPQGAQQVQAEKSKIRDFQCKMCSSYDDYEKLKRFIFDKQTDTLTFWKRISEHMYSKKHLQNAQRFINDC